MRTFIPIVLAIFISCIQCICPGAMNVFQLNGMCCTLACFEAFSAQNGGDVTQGSVILNYPDYCQGTQPIPGYVLTANYVALAALIGVHCEPINPQPILPYPQYPQRAILIGAGNFNGNEHSLLWVRALSGNRGLAMDPSAKNYFRFKMEDLNNWQCSFWMLSV